jgi:hypothetical protein
VFVAETDGIEHSFNDADLEALRGALREAAGEFLHAEAFNGFDSDTAPDRRNIGLTSTVRHVDRDMAKVAEDRRQAVHAAATKFADAHDALVIAAKERRYDLKALEADPPARQARAPRQTGRRSGHNWLDVEF